MIIPIQELSADVLYSVAESYVLRGEAVLVYSELYESVNIVDVQEYQE